MFELGFKLSIVSIKCLLFLIVFKEILKSFFVYCVWVENGNGNLNCCFCVFGGINILWNNELYWVSC